MSDEIKTPEPQVDPIKNLKAEMDRKLGNADSKLTELQKTNELLLSKLSSLTQPAPKAPKEDLSDLLYKDPEAYARLIEERAEKRAVERVSAQQEKLNKVNSIIGSLTQEYPELQDGNHQLTKRAVEIYSALPDEEKQSSLSYKLAVKDAAEELAIKPRSKRPVDEEPSFGSSSGARSRAKATKLDGATEELARMFGIDTSDSKVKERLLAKQNRNWNRYEPVKK
jgi:hypothetical protein